MHTRQQLWEKLPEVNLDGVTEEEIEEAYPWLCLFDNNQSTWQAGGTPATSAHQWAEFDAWLKADPRHAAVYGKLRALSDGLTVLRELFSNG